METQALALQVNGVPTPMITAETVEKALMVGDFSKMDAQTRVAYYLAVCQSAGLNPLTRPFIPMKTQSGEVVLYATRECAEQLRAKHRMSIRIVSRERFDDLYCVTVLGSLPDGRTEEAQGIVEIHNLKGQALANALMRAESKAKRRATLALCGLGIAFLDEAPGHDVAFNVQTGELIGELCDEAESITADTQPIRHDERQDMLAPVGLWMRSIKPTSRGAAIHAVFGSPLSPEEIKQLDRRDLVAGLQRLKMGNEAGIDWESVTLEDDLEKAAARSAAKAKDDLFGGERQEANTPADIVGMEDSPAPQAYQSPPAGQTVARAMPQAPIQDTRPVIAW